MSRYLRECDDIFRNKARLAKHYGKSQVHISVTCYEWEETRYRGDAEIAKHNYLIKTQWQKQKKYLVNACLFEETEAR